MVCLGGGPSLTLDDVNYCRERADAVICINNSYQLAPWATALYAADSKWWRWHREHATRPDELVDPITKRSYSFGGLRYSLQRDAAAHPGVQVLQNTGAEGLEHFPTGLRTGNNGGYQAINLAVHFGVKRILLLGYDMQRGPRGEGHWHGNHPKQKAKHSFLSFIAAFPSLLTPLSQLGIEVINCSPRTSLQCFPQMALQKALP